MRMRFACGVAVALVASAASALPVAAQAPAAPTDGAEAAAGELSQAAARSEAAGRQVYEAAWFRPYAPATALQIVERIPGFAIEDVDTSVRGFGQTAGNVVINGQRPSAKSESLETLLSRIPASRVARVEVGAGDLFGADYAGKPQVVNLIVAGGGVAGTAEVSALTDFTGKVKPSGSVSALLKRGKSSINVAVALENEDTSEIGFDRVTALPGGALVEMRRKTNYIDDPEASGSISWAHEDGADRSAHLNARLEIERFRLTQHNDVTPAAGTVRDDRLYQRYYRDQYEVGGDVTRPLAGGAIKLIGLATRRGRTNRDTSLNRVGGAVTGGYLQRLVDSLEESVLRLTWSRGDLGGWSVETGGEGVINRLRSDVDLYSLGAGGAQTRIDLPVDSAVVREVRGEGFVNAGRALAPNLRGEFGVTLEASRITVRGDATAERSLQFWKPHATFDWKPGDDWRIQLAVERTVAQLQFEDFISGAELSNDRVNGGNPDLVPQRAWESLLTIEHPLLGDGVVKIEAGYQRISLVQDRVPTPEGFDAPGNLGDGTVWIFRPRIDAPLKSLGIKGGRLTLYGSWVSSSVRDPYTRRNRPFSGNSLFYGEANFRQDLGDFAWGLQVSGGTKSTSFRRDEEDNYFDPTPWVVGFVEWRPDARTTLTLRTRNLGDVAATRDRYFFRPDRTAAAPYLREYRFREQHIIPVLTLKRTLG